MNPSPDTLGPLESVSPINLQTRMAETEDSLSTIHLNYFFVSVRIQLLEVLGRVIFLMQSAPARLLLFAVRKI